MDIRTMRLISYAGNAEDVLLMRAFNHHPAGFFVDVGAGDPVVGNVVKNLSDLMGWRGVHVEPNAVLADALASAYPKDRIVCTAVGSRVASGEMFRVPGQWSLSTLSRPVARRYEQSGIRLESEPVRVDTLERILMSASVQPGFELLKIDVEGGESEVLAGFSLEEWRPKVLVVEATLPNSPEPAPTPWVEEVLRAGYELALFDGLNRYYTASGQDRLRERLSVPANVFDRYVPHHWYVRMREQERPTIRFEPWQS